MIYILTGKISKIFTRTPNSFVVIAVFATIFLIIEFPGQTVFFMQKNHVVCSRRII